SLGHCERGPPVCGRKTECCPPLPSPVRRDARPASGVSAHPKRGRQTRQAAARLYISCTISLEGEETYANSAFAQRAKKRAEGGRQVDPTTAPDVLPTAVEEPPGGPTGRAFIRPVEAPNVGLAAHVAEPDLSFRAERGISPAERRTKRVSDCEIPRKLGMTIPNKL